MAHFTPEQYRDAAGENILRARRLHAAGDYLFAHYCSGLAVKCILLAYHYRASEEFSGRHRLLTLYEQSGFEATISRRDRRRYSGLLTLVSLRWMNDYRYRSTESLQRSLLERKLQSGSNATVLRDSSELILEAAFALVQSGVTRWRR